MRMIAPKKEKAVALPDGLNRTKRANVIATRRNRTPRDHARFAYPRENKKRACGTPSFRRVLYSPGCFCTWPASRGSLLASWPP